MRKIYAILIGFAIIAFSMWLIATPHRHLITAIDNLMYDTQTKWGAPHQKYIDDIAIVDIDEKSLAEQGPWPWPKTKFANIAQELRKQGAKVIAFTFVFSEAEQGPATAYLKKLQTEGSKQTELIELLKEIIYLHEGDELLAAEISPNDVILGFLFNQYFKYSKGLLPQPEIELSSKVINRLLIPSFTGYLANLHMLQEKTQYAGFLTGIVDQDGIVRHAPLLATYGNAIYSSLSVQAVKLFLGILKIEVELNNLGDKLAVNKIILGNRVLHTDSPGTIAIPYGEGFKFSYYSATDLLQHRLPARALAGKLVFVGTTVPGLADLRPTPLESLFPGVEIQANIAAAILTNNFLYTPNWNKGAEIGFLIFFEMMAAILFPFLRAISLTVVFVILFVTLIYLYLRLISHGLIFSFSAPLITLILLAIVNLAYGFIFETRARERLFKTFTRYVPEEHAKHLTEYRNINQFTGENRIVTILFADIRHYTDIAENLSSEDVKNLLNRFYTPMSEIITRNKGSIDKYYADMILAFWTWADEKQLSHDKQACDAALEMQDRAKKLRSEAAQLNLPLIRFGVGINSGEAYLGEMGSEVHRSFTVIGDSANLAWRIEELTKFYHTKIIVGEETYDNTRNDFIFRSLDKIAVKGKHKPVQIYELICRKEDATPELLKEIEFHRKALEFYYNRQWRLAYDYFLELCKRHPKIKVYTIFLKRIREFLRSPPDMEWNGTFTRLRK